MLRVVVLILWYVFTCLYLAKRCKNSSKSVTSLSIWFGGSSKKLFLQPFLVKSPCVKHRTTFAKKNNGLSKHGKQLLQPFLCHHMLTIVFCFLAFPTIVEFHGARSKVTYLFYFQKLISHIIDNPRMFNGAIFDLAEKPCIQQKFLLQ